MPILTMSLSASTLERPPAEETAKLNALRSAAQIGWDDIEAGRYIDLQDDELDDFLSQLGQTSAK